MTTETLSREWLQHHAGSQLWSETEVWNKAITACADELRASGIKVEAE